MAKKKEAKRKAPQMTLPIAFIGGFAPLVMHIKSRVQGGDGWVGGIAKGVQTGMGYNPDTKQWGIGNAKLGILPIMLGFGVHKLAGMLGVNRALAQAKIPLIRI